MFRKGEIFILLLLGMQAMAMAANESFDPKLGVLSVDYPHYLSKHNIVFNSPITDSMSGLTVGNGRVGALVWNNNGITAQVTGVDASPQTCFSEGWLNLMTSPRMDANYGAFQQTLNLYDGVITTQYDSNRTVTFMGSPNSELLGIHVEDHRAGVNSVTFQINIWDSSAANMFSTGSWNSMQSDLPDINTWKTVTSFADAAVAGISRGQTDVNHFGYTLAATVDGAAFTTKQVNNRTVQFLITPAASYTIWIACASRQNAPGNNSVTQAAALLTAVKTAGYPATLTAFENWWHGFWAKSFVQYSNSAGDADFLENFYYLANYVIASGAYGKYPFHFVNGVYHSNADRNIQWSGGYWYWDQRAVYNSFLASNHPDVIDGFYRLYSGLLPTLKTLTQSRFNIDGAWTPETMGWNGDATWTTTSTYTDNIYSTGAEMADNMFDRFEYTQDSAFLKNTAYPYMRETAKFLAAKLSYNNTTKQYYMASSNAHETYWNVPNAITDLASVRSLFPHVIQTDKALNADPGLWPTWQTVLDNLVPFKTTTSNGATSYLAYDPPTVNASNTENIACEIIWPYSVTGIGAPDYATALNNWNSRPFPYKNNIMPDVVQSARLGLGDDNFNGMKGVLTGTGIHPNGLHNVAGSYEYAGFHLLSIHEDLLQSYNDTIRVFPTLMTDATFAGKFTLLAKGGFLVSAEREAGDTKYVGVKSQFGGPATLVNPWGTQELQVRKAADNSIVLTASNAFISFNTAAGEVDILERTAKPLSSYTFAALTAAPNYSAKSITYNGKTASLGSGQGKAIAIRSALSYAAAPLAQTMMVTAGYRILVPNLAGGTDYTLELYNLSGRLLKTATLRKAVVDIQKDFGIPNGVYLLRIHANTSGL